MRTHTKTHTQKELEIAALYLNEYSQSQCLINVSAFLSTAAWKTEHTAGWMETLYTEYSEVNLYFKKL